MKEEEKKILNSLLLPFLFVLLLWAIKLVEYAGNFDLGFLGIYPRKWSGLIGIVTSPLVHGDFSHLIANSIPLIVLGAALMYFYRPIAVKVFIMLYLITGIWVWFGARPAYHIGASGVIYALSAFIFVSGLIRKHTGLMAVAMVVAFLYGGMIWGIFPEFFPGKNISWESHLLGLAAGVVIAIFYRKEGPQRRKYDWENEEEEKDNEEDDDASDNEEDAYWKTTITDEEIKNIKRVFRRNE